MANDNYVMLRELCLPVTITCKLKCGFDISVFIKRKFIEW